MPQVVIRCQNCGTRLDTNLNEVELQTLRTRGELIRYCRRCAGNSRWKAAEGTTPDRAGRSDVAELRGGRILLIDDDEDILKVLGKVLSAEKFELDMASSGREAILKLGREDYDLILSDIRMPELDGKQLFAFLDQNMDEYRSKVIFLTGDTGNPETMKFLEQTGCPYLTKPIEIPTLIRLLYQYFSAA
jgi:CheY-like chemotaxis protein